MLEAIAKWPRLHMHGELVIAIAEVMCTTIVQYGSIEVILLTLMAM